MIELIKVGKLNKKNDYKCHKKAISEYPANNKKAYREKLIKKTGNKDK